ncbi:MAG: ATP-dependent Clp protease ATP-binding subunit, partial [Clostridia bacterium]|nr:ATP-dependent Clp protease ATP-binding subunit [Clostridia bacterium]
MLFGLVSVVGSTANRALTSYGVNTAFSAVYIENGAHMAVMGDIGYSKRVVGMFETANSIKTDLGRKSIGTGEFLYAMLLDSTSVCSEILRSYYRVNIASLVESVKRAITENKPAQQSPQQQKNNNEYNGQYGSYQPSQNGNCQNNGECGLPSSLLELGQDITAKAREGKIDAVIGRADEIERIIQILCRKTKNNPVLVGEPGVGKSAVVEGLALAIVEGKVPYGLINKKIFSLDIASLVAGTKYRGALEEKLKSAIEQIKAQGDIIVFIDEIHTLAQAGGKEGEVSPADILKPYLARGEFQTLGATTLDEYRKYIERDKALERRFQPVTVNPPSVDETIRIIRGLKENYENFHKVRLSDEAIVTAVKLADRYIADRFFPDKALDVIDEAMAKAKVENGSV